MSFIADFSLLEMDAIYEAFNVSIGENKIQNKILPMAHKNLIVKLVKRVIRFTEMRLLGLCRKGVYVYAKSGLEKCL